jgi:hypothetical protein
MSHIDWLLVRAGLYWGVGQPLPLDLFAEMNQAGVDVDAEERLFNLMNQYD